VDEAELQPDFLRVECDAEACRLFAKTLSWRGPHEVQEDWQEARVLPPDADPADVEQAKRDVLADPRFFAVCSVCGQRWPVDYMHTDDVCQSCAPGKYGLMY